jgi:hypothetical protein
MVAEKMSMGKIRPLFFSSFPQHQNLAPASFPAKESIPTSLLGI